MSKSVLKVTVRVRKKDQETGGGERIRTAASRPKD